MYKIFLRIINAAILRYKRYVAMPMARHKFQNLDILDSFASIQYIIDCRCSVSRFGDGELKIALGGVSRLPRMQFKALCGPCGRTS